MNKEQILLLKVAEECGELAQMCSKSIRFGIWNCKPGDNEVNIQKLQNEYQDLLVCFAYLKAEGIDIREPDSLQIKKGIARIDKYLQVSRDLGILKD